MNSDRSAALRQAVLDGLARNTPLTVAGSGSKAFYGRRGAEGLPLSTAAHRGILRFEPTELVLTARSGTPLAEIEALLAEHGQMLGFEPPYFGEGATLGGTLACGFSGPRRAFAGAARDFVLGCKLLNGKGEILSFGGEVMKNVAGFDLSRLMVGALGTLGVILEASLKVLPKPECEQTLCFEMSPAEALGVMSEWCGEAWPLSGLAFGGRRLCARLSGAERAVAAAARALGGEPLGNDVAFWRDLCEHRHRFFQGGGDLWRLSLAPATPPLDLPGPCFYDWGGALRWLKTDAPADTVFETAHRHGGHATRFRSASADGRVFQPLPPGLKTLHRNLKRAFDPDGLLNPGRLYEDL
jgi:glycolate oxidase FAD binding subunit